MIVAVLALIVAAVPADQPEPPQLVWREVPAKPATKAPAATATAAKPSVKAAAPCRGTLVETGSPSKVRQRCVPGTAR